MLKQKLDLYHEVHGSGDPLLLIAGLGSDCFSWQSIIKDLSSHYKIIIFDNRGCGRNGVPSSVFTIADMAEDTLQLLNSLKIERMHILGHSLGGYIAQEMAIRYPERVNKLVLASTAAISSQRNNELFADLEKHLRDGEDYSNWVHRWMVWLFSSKKLKDAKFIDEFTSAATAYSYHQTVEGFHGQVEAIKSFDAGNRIDQIKAKTLVLEGEEDILIPPAEAELLAQGIPGSKFQLLKGTGHAVHLDSPELFVSAVLGFLKNNSGEDAILGSMRNTTQNDFDKSYHAV